MAGVKKTLIIGSTVIDKDAIAPYFFLSRVSEKPPPPPTGQLIVMLDLSQAQRSIS